MLTKFFILFTCILICTIRTNLIISRADFKSFKQLDLSYLKPIRNDANTNNEKFTLYLLFNKIDILNDSFNDIKFDVSIINLIDTIVLDQINSIDITTNAIFSRFRGLKSIEIRNSFIVFTNDNNNIKSYKIFSNLNLKTMTFTNVKFINLNEYFMFDSSVIENLGFYSCYTNFIFNINHVNSDNIVNNNRFIHHIIIKDSKDAFESNKFTRFLLKYTKAIVFFNTKIKYIDVNFTNNFDSSFHIVYKNSLQYNFTADTLKDLNRNNYLDLNRYYVTPEKRKKTVYFEFEDDSINFLNDEYFCKYQYFPFNNLVIPLIKLNNQKFNCTCTFYWLFRYAKRYNILFDEETRKCIDIAEFEERLISCNFTKLLALCNERSNNGIAYLTVKQKQASLVGFNSTISYSSIITTSQNKVVIYNNTLITHSYSNQTNITKSNIIDSIFTSNAIKIKIYLKQFFQKYFVFILVFVSTFILIFFSTLIFILRYKCKKKSITKK